MEAIDPSQRGAIATIGIVEDKPFAPDDRMKKLLTESSALGSATPHAIMFEPRLNGVYLYPGTNSVWSGFFANGDATFQLDGTMQLDAAVLYYFNAGGVTPAMRRCNCRKISEIHKPGSRRAPNGIWSPEFGRPQTKQADRSQPAGANFYTARFRRIYNLFLPDFLAAAQRLRIAAAIRLRAATDIPLFFADLAAAGVGLFALPGGRPRRLPTE
jgi:hypothetical protein